LQGKPKHTTCQGTPSPHTSTIPINSPFAARAHRLGIQCSTDPGCHRAVTALVPTIASMGDPVSGRVRRKVRARLHSGTRFTGYHISRHVFSTFKRLTQVSTHHGQGILPGSKSIDHHRSLYQDEYNQFLTSCECYKNHSTSTEILISKAATRPSILVSISKRNPRFMQLEVSSNSYT
jgi:hypothetical protein